MRANPVSNNQYKFQKEEKNYPGYRNEIFLFQFFQEIFKLKKLKKVQKIYMFSVK